MFRCMLLLCLLLQAAAAGAQGQTASREREALRRTQAALREASAERDALKAQIAALTAREAEAAKQATAAGTAAAALRPRLQRAQGEAEALRAELAVAKQQHEQALAEARRGATQREEVLRTQLQAALRERDERATANRSVGALLGETTASLDEARRRNGDLHALARELIERWRHKTPAEALLAADPVLGLAGVRAEDQAERWRRQADDLRLPALR